MNVILRGVRVIDPLAGVDDGDRDVWLRDGRLVAVDRRIDVDGPAVVDLAPRVGDGGWILAPGFIDLHAHLREPGAPEAETVRSGAAAAAAGGFTQVVAMANTQPAVDTPQRVEEAQERAAGLAVRVLPVAAVTAGAEGQEPVDMSGCLAAGAAAFSDDGRNAMSRELLVHAFRAAAAADRVVLVHPEDEAMVCGGMPTGSSPRALVRCVPRPAACEVAAVAAAIAALREAGRGHLHLQHLSAAGSLPLLDQARAEGLHVTAEVTPHHLALTSSLAGTVEPPALAKVNPPLRDDDDRRAMVDALRSGLVDAVATDHAPHPAAEKELPYSEAAPGMIGLETAFATCVTLGGMDGAWLATLVDRLTAGPWRVLGAAAGLREPRLRIGEAATCVLVDAGAAWDVHAGGLHSLSRNTPLLGRRLHGLIVLTLAAGAVVHHADPRLTDHRIMELARA